MILLDQEDALRLDLPYMGMFRVHWDPDDPVKWDEGQALDFPDLIADGPFLLVVNDEWACAGQDANRLSMVAGRRIDAPNLRNWRYLADLYAGSMGISRQGLLLRFAAMSRYLRRDRRGEWVRWEKVYHWPEGGDLAWSSLVYGRHDWFKVREHEGERQVMHR